MTEIPQRSSAVLSFVLSRGVMGSETTRVSSLLRSAPHLTAETHARSIRRGARPRRLSRAVPPGSVVRGMRHVEQRRGVVIEVRVVERGKLPDVQAHRMPVVARMRAGAVVGDVDA